jgi:hypothetical protein
MTLHHVSIIFLACIMVILTIYLCSGNHCESGIVQQVIAVALSMISGTVGHAQGIRSMHKQGLSKIQEVMDPSLLESGKRPM